MNTVVHSRTLVLARHAKSSWKFPNLEDHDRPLNKRGMRDAPLMAARLAKKGLSVGRVISSTALRASSFAQAIAQQCDVSLELNEELYTFSSRHLMRFLRGIDDTCHNVVVVAHNPAITAVASYLANTEFDNVPTSGFVALQIDALSWQQIEPSNSTLIEFDYPKRV